METMGRTILDPGEAAALAANRQMLPEPEHSPGFAPRLVLAEATSARSPFSRLERALSTPDSRVALGGQLAGDPFAERGELTRRHRPAHHVAVDQDSIAVRDARRRERIYRWLLAGADALVAVAAMAVAIWLLGGYGLAPLFVLVAPLIVLAAKVGGLYDKDELVVEHSTLNELPRLLNLAAMLALIVWLARHYLVIGAPRTINLLTLWGLFAGGLVLGRVSAREVARRVSPAERCLLVGRRSVFERLETKFSDYSRASVIGSVTSKEIANDLVRLREIAERDHIHRIIIDTDSESPARILEIVRAANATGLQVSLLPSMLAAVGGSVVFDDIGGLVLMGVPRFGLSRSSLALKRTFDVAAAAFGLLFAAPLMALIGLAIKLDTPGPLLFSQTRVGRDGTPFRILKFRTMVDGADALKDSLREHNEADGLFKIDADPRITRSGRLLRRSGLDELPQLINVLAGDMSLVGPRPLVPDEDRRVNGFDRHRLHLTPGITGRWQTLGAARVPLSEMVKIDYLYIANWSAWADLKIIIETVGYLARRRGQ
jgi:exopolysaccharide biosynthesis polyprenyl glycosylphosphotransferase